MRKLVLPAVLSVFFALTVLAAEIPASVDKEQIPNYQKIRPDLATSAQPALEAVKKLKEMGFKTVVNLRMPQEGIEKDREAVEAQGLSFVSVPITPVTFSAKDVEAVAKVLDDQTAGPTLLYCSSANRVGAVWTVYEVRKGKSLDEALAEGKKIGLKSPAMVDAVQRVVKPAN
jgi:uncharacterized protein (TIGR01244 family)